MTTSSSSANDTALPALRKAFENIERLTTQREIACVFTSVSQLNRIAEMMLLSAHRGEMKEAYAVLSSINVALYEIEVKACTRADQIKAIDEADLEQKYRTIFAHELGQSAGDIEVVAEQIDEILRDFVAERNALPQE